jgi:hypothetical protein
MASQLVASRAVLSSTELVSYLNDGCTKKQQLDSLLASHNLCNVVNFPTRISNSSATTIDNFFIDKCRKEAYSIYSLSNGLSDDDAQILILNNLKCLHSHNCVVYTRDINEFNKSEFKLYFNCEMCADIFTIENDVNLIFNNVLNAYLIIFNHSFPYKKLFF